LEVINGGFSGESLYDAWQRFLHEGLSWRPDLLVLLLCSNDAELFSVNVLKAQGQEISYAEHTTRCWEQQGLHFPHFLRCMGEVARISQALELPLMLAFYEIHDSKIRGMVAERMGGICEQLNLPFVDLSQDFIGPCASTTISSLQVNVVDGHPSDEAHRIAARRLGRALLNAKLIPQPEVQEERALLQRLERGYERRLELGYPGEYLWWHLPLIWEEKQRSQQRRRLPEEKLLKAEEQEIALKCWRARGDEQLWLMSCQAAISSRDRLRALRVLDRVKLLARGLSVLQGHLSEGHALISYYSGDPQNIDLELIRSLPGDLERWTSQLQRLHARLEAQPLEAQALIKAPLQRSWAELESLLGSLYRFLRNIALLLKQSAQMSRIQLSTLAGLLQALRELSEEARAWLLPEPPPLKSPLLSWRVRLQCEAQEPLSLWLQLQPQDPARLPCADMRWVIPDGGSRAYTLELPLCLSGRLLIQLRPQGPAIVEALECHWRGEWSSLPLSNSPLGLESEFQLR